jgi:osmotically-inducible protein OsmY
MTSLLTNRSDAQIQDEVLDELRWDPQLQPYEISAAVKDGVVTLAGTVDNYMQKWAAERAALRVRGVAAVANDIEVELLPADERPDPDIAAAAEHALAWDSTVPADRVTATVSQGWVTLHGEVTWDFQRRAAERAVRGLTGIRGVTNLINVTPPNVASADEVRKSIEDALLRSAETEAQHITVDVKDGKVILKGRVHSWAERRAAEQAAWWAPGVKDVDNRLKVTWLGD